MAILKKQLAEQEAEEAKEAAKDPYEGYLNPKNKTFTYEEIKGKFPEGIKGDSKEWYMSDAEFEQVMGLNKGAYT